MELLCTSITMPDLRENQPRSLVFCAEFDIVGDFTEAELRAFCERMEAEYRAIKPINSDQIKIGLCT